MRPPSWHLCEHDHCWAMVHPYDAFCEEHQSSAFEEVVGGIYDGSTVVTVCGPRQWDDTDTDVDEDKEQQG